MNVKIIKIIDDFFYEAYEIEEILKSPEFSWFYKHHEYE